MVDEHRQATGRVVGFSWEAGSTDIAVEETLLRFWALVSVPQMDLSARILSKRLAWAGTPEKYTMRKASSSQGPHSAKGSCVCGRWEPGTHISLSYPFSDRDCARPCCGLASSSCLLRSTALETTQRMLETRWAHLASPVPRAT